MIKRILLGLGGTPYTTVAIRRAVELAKRFEAEVTGVTVIDVKGLSNVGPVPARALHATELMTDKNLLFHDLRIPKGALYVKKIISQKIISQPVVSG